MSVVRPLRSNNSNVISNSRESKKPPTRSKITLKTTLKAAPGIDSLKVLAAIKRRKRIKLTRHLEHFITYNELPKMFFRPLEKYLIKEIKGASPKANQSLQTKALLTYLENQNIPGFSITYI